MGIIVNKANDHNSELARRISSDLREKVQSSATGPEIDPSTPDSVEGSDYLKDFQKTSRFGWVWAILIFLAIVSLISILFF